MGDKRKAFFTENVYTKNCVEKTLYKWVESVLNVARVECNMGGSGGNRNMVMNVQNRDLVN